MDLNCPKELNHLASRNHQPLPERVPLLAPGPFQRGGFYSRIIPGIWFLLQGHTIQTPILHLSQMGHLDGLMTNQPMITHNCGVMHLVSFIFGGVDLAMTQL